MSEVDEKVKELAKLAVISNRISEVHEKNMKTYPFIFFDGLRGVKIDYDLSSKGNIDESDTKKLVINAPVRGNFVKYYLTVDPQVQNPNMDRRTATLESSIRSLFWKDVILYIYINDKLVFESKKHVK